MKTQLSNQELTTHFHSDDFVLKTQRQIVKDFYVSGVSFGAEFEISTLSFETICDVVGEKIEEVMQFGETQFLQLLYQIDIPQGDFLNLTTDPNFISKMSNLIVRREAYKVYLRSQF
ncbi:MAG: hypothetical protein QNK23_17360 [Crocinitomicaceae bacterium]|nr:hypothetical protein [Crocinitomicaceae bacterium]